MERAGTHILKARLSALEGHVALHVLCAEAKSRIAATTIHVFISVVSSDETSTYLQSHHTTVSHQRHRGTIRWFRQLQG